MDSDRRKPLGGVTKDAYIHAGGHELTYDLICGLKGDLCHEVRIVSATTKDIKTQCECRLEQCHEEFDSRYVKKASKKLPVSLPELIMYTFIIGALFGLGYLTLKDVIPKI